jgi:hypothetical protein
LEAKYKVTSLITIETMHCQYHIIFYAGCSHAVSVDGSHVLPNCDENRGWTVEYDNQRCSSCTAQDTSENSQLIPPAKNQSLIEEDLAYRLGTSHLQTPKTECEKLEAELAENLERRFLQVPKDNRLKMDAESALLLYLRKHGPRHISTEEDMSEKDRNNEK